MKTSYNSNIQTNINNRITLLLFLLSILLLGGCSIVERFRNTVVERPPYKVSEEVEDLHNGLFIADLHADSLLWNRDLLNRHNYGHVDIPRLVEGKVALQVFSVVTKVPFALNPNRASDNTDLITPLVIVQGRPIRTWGSLMERAKDQADKLIEYTKKSRCEINEACTCEGNNTCSDNNVTCTNVNGVCRNINTKHLKFIKSVNDLNDLISERETDLKLVGVLLAIEGAHVLEYDDSVEEEIATRTALENLEVLYNKGFRMIGLTHFFDNKVGGSAHGTNKGGLEKFGEKLIQKMKDMHMVIDLAHASPKLIEDVLKEVGKEPAVPVIVSHTGVLGTCYSQRNISDKAIKGIARTGGIIGIGMFEDAVCNNTIENTANAIRYVADLVGVKYVAVGSDFDGSVKTPMDASGMKLLTDALKNHQHFEDKEIELIMGENVIRVLREVLPQD